ncbi:hypothetical protein VTN00DRAFT_8075 [Thermoascus crustaceus]|uniref:uncharacterized protein n=1 Tax=Thermoascus crustaceus TaxID=5088 RepID=UPI003743B44B
MAGSLFRDFLNPFFSNKSRPVHEDDVLKIRSDIRQAEFDITLVAPLRHGVIGPGTYIDVQQHSTVSDEGGLSDDPVEIIGRVH